jgi:ethanolamine utilization protein EutQ
MKGGQGMKKLICAQDIEKLHKEGKNVMYIDSETIVTPSAKDLAKSMNIALQSQPCGCHEPSSPSSGAAPGLDSNLIYGVLKNLVAQGKLEGLFDQESAYPYECETDASGVKMVRGKTVKFDVFDTGNPSAKVEYQELVGQNESKTGAGFLTIENSSFEWELTYDEIDYVIEGTLHLTINGKTFVGHPGDVLFVPAGSKVVWGSPDKMKAFYAVYPSNWPDLL